MSVNMPLNHDQFAARNVRSDDFMTPAELISGPCALPDAPIAMPRQQLERDMSLARRVMVVLRLRARRLPAILPERGV
ncbi:MAG: hypothetical protein CML30_10285 [Rhizobiales bacterium]|nr:hypothetical protein [Hyphomicrobiales bacterium]|tara:strand:+ start:168 stop:401 length:234 start_codon:yes stop_codon:yes gene_type:complete